MKKSNENVTNGSLLVYYEPQAGKAQIINAVDKYGSEILYDYKNMNCIAVTIPHNKKTSDAIRYFGKINGVLSVIEDKKVQLD